MEGYWKDDLVPYELSDLSRSVFATLGLSNADDVLGLGKNPQLRECIFLVDGLGQNAIDNFADKYVNIKNLFQHSQLQATFPSTTATSLTSLGTGRKPGEHGMVGYTMRVPHSGPPERLLNALKWDERVDPLIWQPHETLFERASREGISVSSVAAKRFENTGFTRAAFRGGEYLGSNSADELIDNAARGLKRERSFVYLYVNDVDEASHLEGFGSPRFHIALTKVNELIGRLQRELPRGTRLWVSADHGMVNREEICVIGKDNNLLTDVVLLGGEPRARYLYVTPENQEAIRKRWSEYFGEKISIFSRDEAISAGLFGTNVAVNVHERIGDLIVIAHGNLILVEMERESHQSAMVGHHGGTSLAEIEIPLLMAACGD